MIAYAVGLSLAVLGFGIKWAAIVARVSRMLAQLSG
jgi:hypothetical protein